MTKITFFDYWKMTINLHNSIFINPKFIQLIQKELMRIEVYQKNSLFANGAKVIVWRFHFTHL